MADAEFGRWNLAQLAHPGQPARPDYMSEADEEASWVMLGQNGNIVPMPNEKILYSSKPRVGLDISTPHHAPDSEPYAVKSNNGRAYVTNQRVSVGGRNRVKQKL